MLTTANNHTTNENEDQTHPPVQQRYQRVHSPQMPHHTASSTRRARRPRGPITADTKVEELSSDDEVGQSHAVSRADWAPGQTQPTPTPTVEPVATAPAGASSAPTLTSCVRTTETPSTPPRGPTRTRVTFDSDEEEHHATHSMTTIDDEHTCRYCQATHTSRNALFEHLPTHYNAALVEQRVAELESMATPPPTVMQQQQRSAAMLTSAAAITLATAHQDHSTPTDFPDSLRTLPHDVAAPTLLQVAPLPTGGGPLGLSINISNPEDEQANENIIAYYDSGAWSSAVSAELCTQLGATVTQGNGGKAQTLSFSGFTAGERNATHTTVLTVNVGEEEPLQMRFWVVPDSPVPLLMGRDNMSPEEDEPDDGRACTLDPDINSGSVTFKRSQRTYPAARWRTQPTATILTTATIPAETEMLVEIQTNTPNATLDIPQAWITSTLLCAHTSTVTCTDSQGRGLILIANIDSSPTLMHAGTTLETNTAPTLLAAVTDETIAHGPSTDPSTTDPKTDHGVTPLTQTSDDIKKGTTWGNKGQHDVVTTKAYMSQQELRRHLRAEVESNQLLSQPQRKKLTSLLMENLAAFSDELTPIGHVTGHDVSFKRTDNKPIWIPPRKMNPVAGAEAIRQVHELEEAGVVHKTTSPNNFPLCMVRKDPGSAPRMCVDLRAYNVRYVGEYFKIPEIRDCLNTISQSRYYSALDATASFHMVPLKEDDGPTPSSHQIAFTLPNSERYAYRKLPFGTKDSSFVFSRVLSQILADYQEQASIYIDDVCLHTDTIDAQIALLAKVLPRLIAAGVRLNPRKTKLIADRVDVLGHTVSHDKIEIQTEKLDAIRTLEQPTSRKELQSLVGVLSWSRRFVADYATIAEPLTRLLRKGQPTEWPDCWGTEQETAFRQLQTAMLTHPSLATPNFKIPFEVWTDASDLGIGAVLVQEAADGTKCAVEFYSKQLSPAEKKYAACEKEALAVLRALTRFRTFLLMANTFTIVVRSDHKGLTSLYKHADESSRLYRWAQQLNEYDYTLQYMSGKSMDAAVPDGLSRARILLSHVHEHLQHNDVDADVQQQQPRSFVQRRSPVDERPTTSGGNVDHDSATLTEQGWGTDDHDNKNNIPLRHTQLEQARALCTAVAELDDLHQECEAKLAIAWTFPGRRALMTVLHRIRAARRSYRHMCDTNSNTTPHPSPPTLAVLPRCKKKKYGCKKARGHPGPCSRRPVDKSTANVGAAPDTTEGTPPLATPSTPPTPADDASHTTCKRQPHCTKRDKHSGRCQKAPVHAPDDDTVTRYDHIVCRAIKNGGVQGFRVRWRNEGPEKDSYETKRQMQTEITHHNLDALISDFVLRERQGDVDISMQPGDGYPQWSNSLSPTAPTPKELTEKHQQTPPFPAATAKSDRGFRTFDGIDAATMLKHQQQEPDTQDYLRYLSDGAYRPTRLPTNTHGAWQKYAASMHIDQATGLLMRRYLGTTGPHIGQQHHVMVLPETLLQRVFDWSHTLVGHHGAHATLCTIKTRFHCWKLETRVRACVAACELCSRAVKDNRQHPYGSIPVSTFNAAVGFDLMGPFSAVGGTGQEYLAVMVDHATKYLVVHAINGPDAQDAVEALQEYVLQMGTIPEKIFSDRGSFTGANKVYAALLARFGIKHHQALSYNPQGDSHAEAGVKNISSILRKIVQDHPDRWPEAARWAAYCYNCKYNTTTGTSPFYALHAVEPTQPIDFLMPRPTTRPVPKDITELADRIGQINEAIEIGVEALHKSYQARNASLRGVKDFQPGDLVWKHRLYPESFKVAGIDTKWFLPYDPEPYMVLERRSQQHCRIRLAYDTTAPVEDIHHQRLKRCSPREDALQYDLVVPVDSADTTPNTS